MHYADLKSPIMLMRPLNKNHFLLPEQSLDAFYLCLSIYEDIPRIENSQVPLHTLPYKIYVSLLIH
jgi:hypothetical protein